MIRQRDQQAHHPLAEVGQGTIDFRETTSPLREAHQGCTSQPLVTSGARGTANRPGDPHAPLVLAERAVRNRTPEGK